MPTQFEELVKSGHPGVTLYTTPQASSQPVQYTQIPESILRILDSDMSSTAAPISPAAFANALNSLTLPTLHAKAAEIRNQRAHLLNSNVQLQEFADAGDEDCRDAIRENGVVLERMDERLELLKQEVVEKRGMMWVEEEQSMDIDRSAEQSSQQPNGDTSSSLPNGISATAQERSATLNGTAPRSGPSGSLGDDELARRLQERMAEDTNEDDEGVHL